MPDLACQTDAQRPARNAARRLRYWLAPLAFALLQVQAAPVSNPSVEYQVKASLVFNFMHFIEWPPEVFQDGRITVCLIGRDVYGSALRVLGREVVQGRKLDVRTYGAAAPGNVCQVVIFSAQERDSVRQALAAFAGKSILTVGETPGFLEDGGIVKFTIVNDTVQFEINLDQARQSRLEISSKLLRLASNVVTSDQAVGIEGTAPSPE